MTKYCITMWGKKNTIIATQLSENPYCSDFTIKCAGEILCYVSIICPYGVFRRTKRDFKEGIILFYDIEEHNLNRVLDEIKALGFCGNAHMSWNGDSNGERETNIGCKTRC